MTVLGMSVGIGTVIFLVSLGYGLQYILIGKLVTTEDSLRTLDVYYPSESVLTIDEKRVFNISFTSGSAEVSPVAEFTGETSMSGGNGLIITRIVSPNYFRLSGLSIDIGSAFGDKEPSMVISSQAAKIMNLAPDKTSLNKQVSLKIYYQGSDSSNIDEIQTTQPLSIKGIINDDLQPPFAIIPVAYVSKPPPFYKDVLDKALDIDHVQSLRDQLISEGYSISARIDLVNQAKQAMNVMTIVMGVFGITALIVSAIGMFNTMVVSFLERIYEVGIMKSLGATNRDVRNMFLMESFIMGLLGGICGVVLGIVGGQLFNFILNIIAHRLGGKSFQLFITPVWFALLTIFLSSLIGIISGLGPSIRASYLSPKEAFRSR